MWTSTWVIHRALARAFHSLPFATYFKGYRSLIGEGYGPEKISDVHGS